jgi:hypothetical protein
MSRRTGESTGSRKRAVSRESTEGRRAKGFLVQIEKSLAEWLRESLRSGYLFGCYDEPLDEAGKRVVRAILDRLSPSHGEASRRTSRAPR